MEKEIIKKVFDNEFNINKMRKQILLKNERKEKKYMTKFLRYGVIVCVTVLICGILIYNNKQDRLNNNEIVFPKGNIFINEIDEAGAKKIDADIKINSTNDLFIPWLTALSDIKIPNDLDKFDSYSIYSRKDKTSEYNILNCYVYDYYNEDNMRSIRISFSNKYKPVRDYYFSENTAKTSIINGVELVIFKYKELYFTEFKYKDYNFDIETSNITIEELKMLLTSIIK